MYFFSVKYQGLRPAHFNTLQGTAVDRRLKQKLLVCSIVLFGISSLVSAEPSVLLGSFRNNTTLSEFNSIHFHIYRQLSALPFSFRIEHDTTLVIDSFPDDASLLKAREMQAGYMLWGTIDGNDAGTGIVVTILDMVKGGMSHIRISVDPHENSASIAGKVVSKLQLWLQRSTMVQLIVTTQPPAATLLLDRTTIGETPFEGMVNPGTYLLELEKKGSVPVRIPASFLSGNTYQYDITLGYQKKGVNRGPVFRWLGISLGCLGAGGIAHYQYLRARKEYQEAIPPDDFDALYRTASIWNSGRTVLYTAAGAAACMVLIRAVF